MSFCPSSHSGSPFSGLWIVPIDANGNLFVERPTTGRLSLTTDGPEATQSCVGFVLIQRKKKMRQQPKLYVANNFWELLFDYLSNSVILYFVPSRREEHFWIFLGIKKSKVRIWIWFINFRYLRKFQKFPHFHDENTAL